MLTWLLFGGCITTGLSVASLMVWHGRVLRARAAHQMNRDAWGLIDRLDGDRYLSELRAAVWARREVRLEVAA